MNDTKIDLVTTKELSRCVVILSRLQLKLHTEGVAVSSDRYKKIEYAKQTIRSIIDEVEEN